MQEASANFFVSVSAAYLGACGCWLMLTRLRPKLWPRPEPIQTDRPWLDMALGILAAFLVLALGQVFRKGYLLPRGSAWIEHVTWTVNNLIIYSPVFLVCAIRRQKGSTLFLSPQGLGRKLFLGCVFGTVSVLLFLFLRGEMRRLPVVMRGIMATRSLAHFLPVFLEGVILAFLFVRIRWALGSWLALLLPAVLFAVGHLPGQLSEGRLHLEIAAFFVLNTMLPAGILYVVQRSGDIIWIGIVHYAMDVAIEAFA